MNWSVATSAGSERVGERNINELREVNRRGSDHVDVFLVQI